MIKQIILLKIEKKLFTHVLLHYYACFIPRLAYVGIIFDKHTQYSPLLVLVLFFLKLSRSGLSWVCLSKFIPTYANLGIKHA